MDKMKDNASDLQKALPRHLIVRTLVFGFILFVGVTGGVYMGTAISDRPSLFETTPEVLDNNSHLKIGNEFPDYTLVDLETNEQTSVAKLSKKGPVLFIFTSPSCDACHHMIPFFNRNVASKLRKDINVALLIDENEISFLEPFPDSLVVTGARYFLTDRTAQTLEDGIHAIPSIVGIGSNQKIEFIMTGYNSRINAGFINKYL